VSGPEGRARLRAVVESYFRQGGQQLQISVASTEDMKAALERPEEFASLMVRVGGFSAYFTQLERRWQDDLIARSEMGL
jgi:formate C-acetyltransferase